MENWVVQQMHPRKNKWHTLSRAASKLCADAMIAKILREDGGKAELFRSINLGE